MSMIITLLVPDILVSAAQAILKALKTNQTVQNLDLSLNDFSFILFSDIEQVLRSNRAKWNGTLLDRLIVNGFCF